MNLSVLLAATILFDTDPGKFTDDSVALVMCARSPKEVTLAGVTTVSGNVWARDGVVNARRTLAALGKKNIPVHLGAQDPLLRNQALTDIETARIGPPEFTGAFATPVPPHPKEPASGVDFLIRTIEREPGVTILAIGPLTNIAILLRLRPDLAEKIGRIVIMGGNVHVPGNASKAAEFNFWFDPEAARIVLRSAIPKKVLFGLDICNKAVLTKAHFDKVVAANTPVTALYREAFGNEYPGFLKKPEATGYLWDELAAGYLIDPGFVTGSEEAYLDVETAFGAKYGAVIPLARAEAPEATPVEVMLDLDFPRVVKLYTDLLTRH